MPARVLNHERNAFMSGMIKIDTLEEGGKKMLRMRCRLDGVDVNTLLFFVDRKVVYLANCRSKWFRRGYRTSKVRYPFYNIGYLGLRMLIVQNFVGPRPGWSVVLGLAGGGVHEVSLGSEAYDEYNAAVHLVCSLTGIRRFDPKL
jgi:hypothetical protein